MMITYPPSPTTVPKRLTKLSLSYTLRAFLAILSVFLFFALYLSLVSALTYLVYYAIVYDMVYINKITILLKLGAICFYVEIFV